MIHERMGLQPLRKTTNPEGEINRTPPAPWKAVTQKTHLPWKVPQQTLGPWNIPQQTQPAWKATQQIQEPACLLQSAFPPLPQLDERIVIREPRKAQPVTSEKYVTTTMLFWSI